MKKIIASILFLFLMTIPLSASETQLMKDMISFDRAYIPSLAMTSQEKREPSIKALEILTDEWKSFKEKYYAFNSTDTVWQSDMDSIEEGILEALDIIDQRGSLSEAHEAVEGIRFTMMQMRERQNIDYFVDHLTRFHDPMEMILMAVVGKTPETLSNNDLTRIKSALPEAVRLWGEVGSFNLDPSIYDLDEKRMKNINAAIPAEKQALQLLVEVLGKGDESGIIKAASAIKPNFAKVFMQFGDFERLKNR